jgi:hypothetical protein
VAGRARKGGATLMVMASRYVWASFALLAFSSCSASMRGGRLRSLRPEDNALGRAEARVCGEPQAARRARIARQGCLERCSLVYGELSAGCSFVTAGELRAGVATLNMHGLSGVSLRVRVCDPAGINMHLADSPTAVLEGGDAGSSDNDAQLILDGASLTIRPSEAMNIQASRVENFVDASGCSMRTIEVADSAIYLVDEEVGLCGAGMLRIDPPTDPAGRPDALWYLALGTSVDGRGAAGRGLESVELCSW